MKAKEIEEMKAGPELDLLVMRYAFGLEAKEGEKAPEYSTSLNDAMSLALFLSASTDFEAYSFELHRDMADKNIWTASFDDYRYEACAETPQLAICRAALKVFHTEDEEE